MRTTDVDVVIVGGGGAGLSAAICAADGGASVALVERERALGGSTALSNGVFYAAGTSVQRAAGVIGDTADRMLSYYLTLNQWKVDVPVVRRLCDEGAAALEWLIDLGAEFPPNGLYRSGVDDVSRGHKPRGGGDALVSVLARACRAREVSFVMDARVSNLLVDDDAVRGVVVDGEEIRAGAVVLASGGFAHDPTLMARLYPRVVADGDWAWSAAAPGSTGDGITIAERCGAEVTGVDKGQTNLTTRGSRELETPLPPWVVLVNEHGRRLISESAPYAVLPDLVAECFGRCFAVFDEDALNAFPDAVGGFGRSRVRESVAAGGVAVGATVAEVASAAGIDQSSLVRTIDRYNAACRKGVDEDYGKPAAHLMTVGTRPIYAIELRRAAVSITGSGLRIDRDARVLRGDSSTIDRLFACGEVVGNVFGPRYIGGGIAIASAITFGRIAGASAAAAATADESAVRA